MADTDSPLAQVDHLLQQREQYEQWLARLDGTGSKAPDAVRQKVRADYQARLDAVLVELRSHVSSVEVALSGHNESLASLEARQADIQERLAEAEIRHAVGEYTDDEWGAVGAEAEAALDEIGRRIGAEQGEITRLSAVLHLVAKPRRATAGRRRRPSAFRPPCRSRPPRSRRLLPPRCPGAPRFVPKTPGAMPRASTPDAAAAQAGGAGGRTRLPQVGDRGTADRRGRRRPRRCRTAARCGPSTSAQEPPAVAVDGDNGEAAPAARPGAASNAKTLKCGECGTLNRPTEWYCERCGAELAAL